MTNYDHEDNVLLDKVPQICMVCNLPDICYCNDFTANITFLCCLKKNPEEILKYQNIYYETKSTAAHLLLTTFCYVIDNLI